MIAFPIFKSLTIENYGLYPPSLTSKFTVNFDAGPTVIVGVNGSGKTTLLMLLLRLLTGPYDLPARKSDDEMGQITPSIRELKKKEKNYFASRVSDGAENAKATLIVHFGKKEVEICRDLKDLKINSLKIEGKTIKDGEKEKDFQKHISGLIGVDSFFDVLLILRFLVFMLEDRRSLIWDSTAQRQILRVLLLSPSEATRFALAQQEVISADSGYRNIHAVLYRQKKQHEEIASRTASITDVEAELRVKLAEVRALRDKLDEIANNRIEADNGRKEARLNKLQAAEGRETALRELEHTKMSALRQWFTPTENSVQYILGHLLAENRCLVCDSESVPAVAEIEKRIKNGLCPICGSKHKITKDVISFDKARIKLLEEQIKGANAQINVAEVKIQEANEKFIISDSQFEQIKSKIIELDQEILSLQRRLPPDRAALTSAENDINTLEKLLEKENTKREIAERSFRKLLTNSTTQIQKFTDDIVLGFAQFLKLFVKEEASLIYQTVDETVAQGLTKFKFPVFRLNMSGGAISGITLRTDADEVSQSQAEFVDLAFRMSLMSLVGEAGASSLIVDAPEASLDFLFAERAGEQLLLFARKTDNNRVIVTSYLPGPSFVAAFISDINEKSERESRIVDLIQYAAPNAALKEDKEKYTHFLSQIIKKAKK